MEKSSLKMSTVWRQLTRHERDMLRWGFADLLCKNWFLYRMFLTEITDVTQNNFSACWKSSSRHHTSWIVSIQGGTQTRLHWPPFQTHCHSCWPSIWRTFRTCHRCSQRHLLTGISCHQPQITCSHKTPLSACSAQKCCHFLALHWRCCRKSLVGPSLMPGCCNSQPLPTSLWKQNI